MSFFTSAVLFCAFLSCCYGFFTLNDEHQGGTLASPGEKFELGFFTPNGSSTGKRYVGIWYFNSNPLTVVWVANRDNPLPNHVGNSISIAEDGNLNIVDINGTSYWSTGLEKSESTSRSLKLTDTGNLVLVEDQVPVWQSFDNPTDTFLPGMKINEEMGLISWKSYNDPGTGNFSFKLDQDANQFAVWKRSVKYWGSGMSGKDGSSSTDMPPTVAFFLSNFTLKNVRNDSVPRITMTLYNLTRLVMSFSGQIQYLLLSSEKTWSLIWGEPRDRCGLYNACGNFGSCNGKNELACKCLPGFHPVSPEYWSSGDYSGGCARKSGLCSGSSRSSTKDGFLKLKMMKVGNPDSEFKARDDKECQMECLDNCQCQGYSYEDQSICRIWLQDLTDLQEEYDGGRELNVRVSDYESGTHKNNSAESTARSCETCGTSMIPYPLSTGPNCGDPMYSSFQCNTTTGQISFQPQGTTTAAYRVTMIDPESHKFVIQTDDTHSCKSLDNLNKSSSPFHVMKLCNADVGSLNSELSFKLEIGYDPPPEPSCSNSIDCKDWPNSSCNETRSDHGKKKRCICSSNFVWDGLNLNCSESGNRKNPEIASKGKMIITLVSVIIIGLVLISGIVTCIYLQRRKLPKVEGLHLYGSKRLIDSDRFSEDETKAIDVPFFELEIILAATDNFSSSNKLGQGGFGPVYKAKFPGGEEIAVKRLSRCSSQGLEEFKNEVVLIAKLQHRNLVRLLGYCVEGDEKILLYEYMPNKSLDSFIFDKKLRVMLDWDKRYNIILGIARGLLYLHQDSRLRIIHRDLKTSNILLDEEMNPKISDFGLARIFGGNEVAANTNRVVGTYGYIAPEYAMDGLFSFKSDIFSFGVVLLEIIIGKRSKGFYHPERSSSLLGYAWNLWKEDKAMELLDKSLTKTCNIKTTEVLKCINIGLLCVQEDPGDRPTVSNVVSWLGSETTSLQNPKHPAFVMRRGFCSSSSKGGSSSCSNNALTVTLEDGR
ncbi:G-type lectin S-receptor-like serine/threonine-protein kinase At4g03230 [Linum perenne]